MKHLIAKQIIITDVTELISNKYQIKLDKARDVLYRSGLADLIDDDETGLYGESPLYVFSIFEQKYANLVK